MKYITKKDYANLHNDYKDVYSFDDIHGTKWNGKKTFMIGINGVSTLLIEDVSFEFVKLDQYNQHEIECEECDGTGATEHDVSIYIDISPQTEMRECEECNGCSTKNVDYEGI